LAQHERLSESAAGHYLARARATQAYTARHLAYYGGARGIDGAPWVAYRRSSAEPEYSDSWYDFSQLLADAALVACGLGQYAPYVDKAFRHLERHWDAAEGGYFGRGGIRGDWVGGPDKYVDDNALAGLALLAAHASVRDRAARARYLARARTVGEYLVGGPLWDEVFDGGFWWNTRRGDTIEGKPAQSNGLAVLFFLRLHAVSGEARWLEWAGRTLGWLDAYLWDAGAGLYRYCVRYAEPAERRGRAVEHRYFNYDQGILIEAWAHLAGEPLAPASSPGAAGNAGLPGAAAALGRARTVARALDGRFWDAALGGYVLEAGVPQLLLVYAAWLTPALVALAAVDADPRWLALAGRNVDTLHAALHGPAAGSYAHRAWRDGGAVRLNPERHTAAQAWMQHAQAALARGLGVSPRSTNARG
jgi:hypothetical protein